MQYIVTLNDFRPAPRADRIPWVAARVEEAATPDGDWTPVLDAELDPVDVDPSEPISRSFTFTGSLESGWYRVTFSDGGGGESIAGVVHNRPAPGENYRPSVSEIGRLLRQRTVVRNSGGRELGTFTGETRPTAEEVEDIIDQAVAQAQMDVGQELPETVWDMARSVIALYAAMLAELTFFAGDVAGNRSPYAQYEKLYDRRLASLKTAVAEAASGGEPGSVDTSLAPVFSFPPAPRYDDGYGWPHDPRCWR